MGFQSIDMIKTACNNLHLEPKIDYHRGESRIEGMYSGARCTVGSINSHYALSVFNLQADHLVTNWDYFTFCTNFRIIGRLDIIIPIIIKIYKFELWSLLFHHRYKDFRTRKVEEYTPSPCVEPRIQNIGI